jgi:hypothetical protein
MKITIESTGKIVNLKSGSGELPARVWEGKTESGIPVVCFVTRIATPANGDLSQFETELQECRTPTPETHAISARMIL